MSIAKKIVSICSISAFYWFEWVIATVTFSLVSLLRSLGYVYWQVFLLLWVGNTLLSWSIIFTNDKTGVDFTLMRSIGKMISSLKQKNRFSRVISLFLGVCLTVWNVFWTGPAQVFLLLRRNRWVCNNKWIVLVVISALQMAVWTEIYFVGYDGVVSLMNSPYAEQFKENTH
jgi:hypothetical protein